MDANGSNLYIAEAHHEGAVRQLTDSFAHDRGPTWSPDGSMVAFLRIVRDRPDLAHEYRQW